MLLFISSDGFLCYKNGLNAMERKNKSRKGGCFDGVQEILSTRIRFVEHQIQQSGGVGFHSQQNRLTTSTCIISNNLLLVLYTFCTCTCKSHDQ